MNSGIYALYWWEQDLVYIGLSQNLSSRKLEHLNKLKNNRHTNYKVQNTYNQYGEPDFIVLDYCNIEQLPEKEVQWCKEFNALGNRGLCLVEPGIVGFGINSNASKHQKLKILKVFQMLYRTNLSYLAIQRRVGVSEGTVQDIKRQKQHLWLNTQYPYQYAEMLGRSADQHRRFNTLNGYLKNKITGEIIPVYNMTLLSTQLFGTPNHQKNIGKVLNNTRIQVKGYIKYTFE